MSQTRDSIPTALRIATARRCTPEAVSCGSKGESASSNADETFHMLGGEVLLHIDGEQMPLHAGGIAIIPGGIPHAFMVTSELARMLCLQTPGSGEEFYRIASEPAVEGEPATPIDFDRVREAATRTGAIELLGPPPF